MVFTLAAVEAEKPDLVSIEAEMDVLRAQWRAYTCVAGIAMHGAIPATVSEMAEHRSATARFQHLANAAAHLRSKSAATERTVGLSVDCAVCGIKNHLVVTRSAHQEMVTCLHCGASLGLIGALVAATWMPRPGA